MSTPTFCPEKTILLKKTNLKCLNHSDLKYSPVFSAHLLDKYVVTENGKTIINNN